MRGRMILSGFCWLLMFGASAGAAIVERKVDYNDGDTRLQGYIYWDDSSSDKRPGVVVVHEWWGLNEYAKQRAKMLAELGYVGFAADMYGTGKATRHPDEAGKWAKAVTSNIDHWQQRALLALEVLRGDPATDANRLVAIGYCFGGATVMQMAYAGAPLKGVVSFHGSLPIVSETQADNIKAQILIAHGADDTFISAEHIVKFRNALDKAAANWEMIFYGGARHSFTNPAADNAGIPALAYHASADRRSWQRLQIFLQEVFNPTQ